MFAFSVNGFDYFSAKILAHLGVQIGNASFCFLSTFIKFDIPKMTTGNTHLSTRWKTQVTRGKNLAQFGPNESLFPKSSVSSCTVIRALTLTVSLKRIGPNLAKKGLGLFRR